MTGPHLDPGFTQLWAAEGADLRLNGHTHYVTYAHDLGDLGCPIPTLGLPWIAGVPPVVLERWPAVTSEPQYGLTTVGSWRSYGSIYHAGRQYGQKAHSVRRLIDLPSRLGVPVQAAFGIHPDERADLAALDAARWTLLDPDAVAATPNAYQQFVGKSWGELGVAKHGYIEAG